MQMRILFIEFAFLAALLASAVLGRTRASNNSAKQHSLSYILTSKRTSVSYSIASFSFFLLLLFFFFRNMRFSQCTKIQHTTKVFILQIRRHSVFRGSSVIQSIPKSFSVYIVCVVKTRRMKLLLLNAFSALYQKALYLRRC